MPPKDSEQEKNSQRIQIASISYKVNSVIKNERFSKYEQSKTFSRSREEIIISSLFFRPSNVIVS